MRNLMGWVRQTPDSRDRYLVPSRRLLRALPAAVDLSGTSPARDDQGQLGSCGPNAADEAIQYDQDTEGQLVTPASRLFIYYCTRSVMGTVGQDSGVDNRSMMKALAQYGFCPESMWPYVESRFRDRPPAECFSAALASRISDYATVAQDLAAMKASLAAGHPFIFGAEVFQGIEGEQARATGMVPMPRRGESSIGGHDVLFVGYDDAKQAFKFQNHWGLDWGEKGFGWWPYAYASNKQLAGDFWTINALAGQVAPPPAPAPQPAPGPGPAPMNPDLTAVLNTIDGAFAADLQEIAQHAQQPQMRQRLAGVLKKVNGDVDAAVKALWNRAA